MASEMPEHFQRRGPKQRADARIIEDAYGGWTHSREDIAAEIAERDAAKEASMKGDRPRHRPIRPWKLTRLAWRSWWRERTNRG